MLAIALGSISSPAALNAAPAAPKPNIVHIMVDDLGWQDIASHKIDGNAIYETPHLDRLTREGRRFTDAHSPAPTCAPSRVSFLRGQYPANTGVYHVMGGRIPRAISKTVPHLAPYYIYGLPVEEPTIAEVLKQAGYVTGHVGKWHAGGKSAGYPFPPDVGFDFGHTEVNGQRKICNDSDLWRPEDRIKNNWAGSWAQMKPDRISDFATDASDDPYQLDEDGRPFDKPLDMVLGFMDKYKDRPFFMNYCPFYVHGPFGTRDRKRLELYCEKMGFEFPTDSGTINPGMTGQSNPYYASMVDTVDWMIGQVVNYLEETDDPRNPGHKLIDNTYIIVDSDNGGYIGAPKEWITDNSPLRGGKMSSYEGGIRIPFIVRGPGVEAGSTCDTTINLIDLFPTFMEMAGAESDVDLELDGSDILPLIHGTSDQVIQADGSERDTLYWFYPAESHMTVVMRKGDWKLVNNLGVGYLGKHAGVDQQNGLELFRIVAADGSNGDLGERENLASQYPEKRDAMLAEMDAFLTASKVTMPYRNLKVATAEERAASPAVLELGLDEDRVWVTLETGASLAAIVEAQLIYTLNPKPFDTTRGHREEWLPAPTKISQGRVDAVMPPGATHALFCMRDANGFLVTSEPMPDLQEANYAVKDSTIVQDGYAYKPGLYALIQLGKQAQASASWAGLDVSALNDSIAKAQAQYVTETIEEQPICDAIRSLRGAIRDLKGTPEAEHPLINRFPTDPLF